MGGFVGILWGDGEAKGRRHLTRRNGICKDHTESRRLSCHSRLERREGVALVSLYSLLSSVSNRGKLRVRPSHLFSQSKRSSSHLPH